jgi:hypothetical protein
MGRDGGLTGPPPSGRRVLASVLMPGMVGELEVANSSRAVEDELWCKWTGLSYGLAPARD